VKKVLNQNPTDVRLVLRYTAFHQGSGEVVLLLEASHRQGLYKEVLEGLLARQNSWASHHAPNIVNAWSIAESVGLDIERAKLDIKDPEILKILEQDTSDVESLGIEKTPTFFVNGKPLETFGLQQLIDLVQEELKS
jgi:predicted DsbA family dithiol-disulfide isomerase